MMGNALRPFAIEQLPISRAEPQGKPLTRDQHFAPGRDPEARGSTRSIRSGYGHVSGDVRVLCQQPVLLDRGRIRITEDQRGRRAYPNTSVIASGWLERRRS